MSQYIVVKPMIAEYNIELIYFFVHSLREIFAGKKFAALAQAWFIDVTETPYFTADRARSMHHLTVEKV